MRWLLRALTTLATWLLALLILFEEWGWEPLARLLGLLAKLPLIGWLEQRIARLPSYAAVAVFFLPAILLLPIKLLALWIIGRGHALLGVAVIVIAKLAGTAVVARLFMLTKPALMRLAWLERWYMRWTVWKEAVIAHVRASAAWRAGRAIKAAVKRRLRSWRRASGSTGGE
ncbi:MAG TPA: hypothetical protein VGQ23_11575 [Burkholderiaceae bacterium]|nr:hypothetical protein [Burkholderiaceae bacterium]